VVHGLMDGARRFPFSPFLQAVASASHAGCQWQCVLSSRWGHCRGVLREGLPLVCQHLPPVNRAHAGGGPGFIQEEPHPQVSGFGVLGGIVLCHCHASGDFQLTSPLVAAPDVQRYCCSCCPGACC
jgi:hypothetical protein